MSGRTKLYQKPGSALIQGHSRSEIPSWRIWLNGLVLGIVIAVVGMFVYQTVIVGSGTLSFIDQVLFALIAVFTAGLPGLLLGSGLGTVLGRGMGWKRPGVSAGVVAALLTFVSMVIAGLALGWSLPVS